ncbi:ATP-binding cassette domain-containing protein [Celerinatantimonas yamalensis]|uniref:ATP-binding cassette domain-containing protein n=1 Tax=Celerinatantimonas yamalensis TaxID=559956 RepID=A0ABW9G3I3_9GAMM
MSALLEITNLSQQVQVHNTWFKRRKIEILKSINLTLKQGHTLSLIGESGSGKSTLARLIAGLNQPTEGEICINGEPLEYGEHSKRCKLIRMIFQDPNTSLNPRCRIGQILEVPLALNTYLQEQQRKQRIASTLKLVGLLPEHAQYYPQMLSNGQKQRVALARALILNPKIVVADESISSLDVSVRSQIINLLLELQERFALSYIIVSNDLGMVSHMSDQVAVMHQGEIVEWATTQTLFEQPQHEITQRLLNAYNTEFKK